MKYVLIRELQELFKDTRLVIFLAIILVITICSGIVSSFNYQSLNKQDLFLTQTYEADLEASCKNSLQQVAFTDHLASIKTDQAMFLSGDISSRYPNHAYVYIPRIFFGDYSSYYPRKALDNSISPLPFIRYDLLFIVEVLFSFMIVMITYNSISKEKETKTLSLILSNGISRTSVLLGKITAYAIIASFFLILAVVVQLLIILFLRSTPIHFSILPHIGIFLLLSLFYLFFWIVLSICISASVKKSAIALTYLIVIWVTFIFIIPSSGRIFLEKWGKALPTSQELKMNYDKIESDMWDETHRKNGGWRGGNIRANAADGHIMEKNFAPVYITWLDVLDNYQYEVAVKQTDQLNFLYNYSSISPAFLYHRIVESFNSTNRSSFLDDIRIYRKDLMQNIIDLDKKDEDSFHLFFLPRYMSNKPVDKELIPRFKELERSYIKTIQHNIFYIILFLSEILLLFIICQFRFNRYDVR